MAGAIERLRKRMGIGSDAIDLLRQEIDGLDQAGIAAQPEQHLVKTEVAVKHRQQIARRDGGGYAGAAIPPAGSISAGATGNGMMRTAITSSSSRTA